METRISDLENKLDDRLGSHPTLVKLWKEYLKIKKRRFENDLIQCENMLDKIEEINDPSPEQLLLLQHVVQMVSTNTT
jgi:hypothetical protein